MNSIYRDATWLILFWDTAELITESHAYAAHTLLPGKPYPLGATPTSQGTNFALYSENATAVHVCFFDREAAKQTDCVHLRERTAFVWHGLIRNIKPGQRYGFRVEGPWEPEKGLRFNAAKLLVDPYAKALTGEVDWKEPIFPYDVKSGDPRKKCDLESCDGVPKGIVIDGRFDWGDDCPPEIPIADSIIYEMNVRGFSMLNSDIPEGLRGTYAGLAHDSSIAYLKKLGITAIELMPVHYFIDEGQLVDRGLHNYWGYNTLGYFCADDTLQLQRNGESACRAGSSRGMGRKEAAS